MKKETIYQHTKPYYLLPVTFSKITNHTNPLLFLSGFNFKVLTAVLDFIYNGKVKLYQEEVDMFLESAQKLKIHGLTLGVQFGEYFQSVLAESGIGYYSILLIIWHFFVIKTKNQAINQSLVSIISQ